MTRAFITVTEDWRTPSWCLIRGGPAEPLHEAATIAGIPPLRWSRTDRAWLARAEHVPDLIAAGENAHLITVRRPA